MHVHESDIGRFVLIDGIVYFLVYNNINKNLVNALYRFISFIHNHTERKTLITFYFIT